MALGFTHREDQDLADELDRVGVFTFQDWAALGHDGVTRAIPLLLKNSHAVKTGPWKAWLVRNHNCLPLANTRISREWVRRQQFTEEQISHFRAEGVCPIERTHGGWLLAVIVPAQRAIWEARMGTRVFFIAAAPSEQAANLPML